MAAEPRVYEALVEAIDQRITSLGSGEPAATTEEHQSMLAEAQSDRAVAMAHWRMEDLIADGGEKLLCAACSEPRPCSTSVELAQKYDVRTPSG